MIAKLLLPLLLGILLRTDGRSVFVNLGENECMNMRNQRETCGLRQFCSESELHKGCRNCTDMVAWCGKEPGMKEKFPSCEVLCEEIIRRRTEEELKATGEVLRKEEIASSELSLQLNHTKEELAKEREKNKRLSDENKTKGNIVWILLGLLLPCGSIMVVVIWKQRQMLQAYSVGQHFTEGTASVEKNGFLSFCSSVFFGRQNKPRKTVIPEETTEMTPFNNIEEESSGRGTGSSPASSDSNLSATVLPNNGTLHHPSDAMDFMQYSYIPPPGAGGGADA